MVKICVLTNPNNVCPRTYIIKSHEGIWKQPINKLEKDFGKTSLQLDAPLLMDFSKSSVLDKAEHCLGSNDNPFLDKLLVNGSTGKPPATFEVNQAMRDVGKRDFYVVSHDPKSIGFFTSKDKTIDHQNIVVSGDKNVDDLLPNLTTSNSFDKSLNDGSGNLVCPVKSKEYLESSQGIGQIFGKNDGVVSESNVGVSSLGFPDDAILAKQVKELVSSSSQHVDVDVDNNTTLGNNIQLGDIPLIVPDENLVHQVNDLFKDH